MSEPILTRNEVATAIIGLTQVIYTSHVHAGPTFLTVDDAVERACLIVGLAQSDMWHQFVQNVMDDPSSASYVHETRERAMNGEVAREQQHRIDMSARAMAEHRDDQPVIAG